MYRTQNKIQTPEKLISLCHSWRVMGEHIAYIFLDSPTIDVALIKKLEQVKEEESERLTVALAKNAQADDTAFVLAAFEIVDGVTVITPEERENFESSLAPEAVL